LPRSAGDRIAAPITHVDAAGIVIATGRVLRRGCRGD